MIARPNPRPGGREEEWPRKGSKVARRTSGSRPIVLCVVLSRGRPNPYVRATPHAASVWTCVDTIGGKPWVTKVRAIASPSGATRLAAQCVMHPGVGCIYHAVAHRVPITPAQVRRASSKWGRRLGSPFDCRRITPGQKMECHATCFDTRRSAKPQPNQPPRREDARKSFGHPVEYASIARIPTDNTNAAAPDSSSVFKAYSL